MPKTVGERVGQLAAETIEALEERYGTNSTVGAVIIVCDLITGDDRAVNPIVTMCNDPRRWIQAALLQEALDVAQEANERREADAEQHERALNDEPADDD